MITANRLRTPLLLAGILSAAAPALAADLAAPALRHPPPVKRACAARPCRHAGPDRWFQPYGYYRAYVPSRDGDLATDAH